MDTKIATAWFSTQSLTKKQFATLMVAHKLTIVLRDIINSSSKHEALAAAVLISELDHRLLSYVTASMTRTATFPDDTLVEMITTTLTDPLLARFASHVWNEVTSTVDAAAVKHP
jgi:hypothetical protein